MIQWLRPQKQADFAGWKWLVLKRFPVSVRYSQAL